MILSQQSDVAVTPAVLSAMSWSACPKTAMRILRAVKLEERWKEADEQDQVSDSFNHNQDMQVKASQKDAFRVLLEFHISWRAALLSSTFLGFLKRVPLVRNRVPMLALPC